MPVSLDAAKAAALLASPGLRYILLDIDGVLWSGMTVYNGIPETLAHFRDSGKQVRFLSNNASVSRKGLLANFQKRGITGVEESQMYNSGYAAALRLQQLLGRAEQGESQPLVHGNVFVVGEQGLHEEIQGVLAPGFITYGLELHDAEKAGGYDGPRIASAWHQPVMPPPQQRLVICNGNTCRTVQATGDAAVDKENGISLAELNPVAVVAGLDNHFNMVKLAYAAMVLQGPPPSLSTKAGGAHAPVTKALFVATNEDPQIPMGPDAILTPGEGCMVGPVATASGRMPDAICGKPHVDMARILFQAEGIQQPRESCLMIGDRLTTDVAFGNAAGCQSMLVLSGAEGLQDVQAAEQSGKKSLIPDYVGDSLAVFLPS